jgi:hypothetical protein
MGRSLQIVNTSVTKILPAAFFFIIEYRNGFRVCSKLRFTKTAHFALTLPPIARDQNEK